MKPARDGVERREIMSESLNALRNSGFIVRDDLLRSETFFELRRRVFQSWDSRVGWNTLSRSGTDIREVGLLDESTVKQMGDDLVRDGNSDNFQYLFHLLHESSDKTELIRDIRDAVADAWKDPLESLLGTASLDTNFSLTCYTAGCFLDPHTDFGAETNYKVTLILYFGSPTHMSDEGNLYFRYRQKNSRIAAIANRSILFVPSEETLHWVPQIVGSGARLAFSGWYI